MAAATKEIGKFCEAYPMKGGDGPKSYAKNSIYQRGAVDAAKEFVNSAIAEKLDMEILSPSNSKSLHIADLGCAVGPNAFFSVDNIIEAADCRGLNFRFSLTITPQMILINLQLFNSLPHNRQYYAASVPGSFYGRLFPNPNASIHFFHSAFAIPWMSRIPKAVVDENSPAWNKVRIFYSDASDDVVRAYKAQYVEDMECFLHARAQEIVNGGLMVLFIAGRPDVTPNSQTLSNFRNLPHGHG